MAWYENVPACAGSRAGGMGKAITVLSATPARRMWARPGTLWGGALWHLRQGYFGVPV